MTTWLMLIYKIPREPTAGRVYTWRKLKSLGAVALQDAVWVLPATPRTQEQLQWLAAEIVDMQGEATLWRSELASPESERELVQRFEAHVDGMYQGVLRGLKGRSRDLAALSRTYQQARAQDYFQSRLGERARTALLAAEARENARGTRS